MDEPRLLMPGGGADTPGGQLRPALLATLLTLVAAVVPLFAVLRPLPLHRVAVDLGEEPCGGPLGRHHRLDVGADESLAFDGERQADLLALRRRLDPLVLEPEARVMLNPHPEARYETVLEVLAVLRRAGVHRVRLACGEGAWREPHHRDGDHSALAGDFLDPADRSHAALD